MKKIAILVLGLVLTGVTYSCKDAKKEKKEVEKVALPVYRIISDSTVVSFKAYKTTDKKPVGGTFTKINLAGNTSGNTPTEALNGLEFSIPVSSLFTNDATGTRDPKILEFFFGMMDNTEFIKGVFAIDATNKCTVDLTINGVKASLPLDYVIVDKHISLTGTLNLENWNALDALASLNKACKVLHTGADGVSKTWE